MTYPTVVWVVMQLDSHGTPRGFEKSGKKFFFTDFEASYEIARCPEWLRPALLPVQCVIMGMREYKELADRP